MTFLGLGCFTHFVKNGFCVVKKPSKCLRKKEKVETSGAEKQSLTEMS